MPVLPWQPHLAWTAVLSPHKDPRMLTESQTSGWVFCTHNARGPTLTQKTTSWLAVWLQNPRSPWDTQMPTAITAEEAMRPPRPSDRPHERRGQSRWELQDVLPRKLLSVKATPLTTWKLQKQAHQSMKGFLSAKVFDLKFTLPNINSDSIFYEC